MKVTLAQYKAFVEKTLRKIKRAAKKNDSVKASLFEDGLLGDFVDYVTTLSPQYPELAEIAKLVRSTHTIEFTRDYEIYDVRFNEAAKKGEPKA